MGQWEDEQRAIEASKQMRLKQFLWFLLLVTAMTVIGGASATPLPAAAQCQIYGYVPHTRDYALCRTNVRRYWTTGPCGDAGFAATHREYCHLNLPPFL